MRKKYIICDLPLLIAVAILTILTFITTIVMCSIVGEENVVNPSDVGTIRLMFVFLLLAFMIAIISLSPRYLCVIALSKTEVAIFIPFRKKELFSYNQFKYVYCGGYFHGNIAGIGKNIWYIVLAQRQFSTNELNAINSIPNSRDAVKIRYTKNAIQKLQSVLPASHITQLCCAISKTRQGDK